MIDLMDMETRTTDKKERFYKVDKALQLVEGTNVAAFWAHLMDAYNYFEVNGTLENENTLYQSAKVIQSFTKIGTKAQNSAKKRLAELGFLKYRVASKPGEATKTTIFILYPDVFQRWLEDHDYDKLRDKKYKELQTPEDKARLDQWLEDNTPLANNQRYTDLGQKQTAEGTFANHTQGHLQTAEGILCKAPKEHVIETKELETIKIETTQTSDGGCVYLGEEYAYLQGKSKSEILELAINEYSKTISKNISDFALYSDSRYIGELSKIEPLFNKYDLDKGVRFYVGVLGYLESLVRKKIANPKAFDAAYKFENLLKFQEDIVFTLKNKELGSRRYEQIHSPKVEREFNPEQAI